VKKTSFFCFFIFIASAVSAAKLDINIIYEASRMKVKETVCGWQPDLSAGYVDAEDDCFMTRYELEVPMYGFKFEPVSGPVPTEAKCVYYISFFDSAMPKEGFLTTEVVSAGEGVRAVKNLLHNRTFQGLVILKDGETIRMSTEKEPPYTVIYVIAALFVAAGLFLILRRRK